ncbi:MAG: molecular chaperone HtpG, partial [Clostridia bacterium]
MVSANVKVFSRAAGEDLANCWESNGADGYTISKCEREEVGSCVILKLKENTEDENFDEFLDEYRISELITKYSDYIRYPIRMDMTKSRLKEGSEDEYESYTENTTINSMIPIWKKAKNEVTDEDYNTFYSEK